MYKDIKYNIKYLFKKVYPPFAIFILPFLVIGITFNHLVNKDYPPNHTQ